LPPQLVLAGIATAVAISFNILLPVVPVLMERRGPHGAAGAATAALFVGAVLGELLTPWLMSRWSSTRLLAAGQLMTAVPSLVYVLPHQDGWMMLAAAAARGLGMGVAIVVAVALVGEYAAPDRRGRSMGYFGFALTAPGVVVPSAAVALLGAGHADTDAVIAFVIGLAGALLVIKLPRPTVPSPEASANPMAAFRMPGLLSVYLAFVLVSCSFGAVITFAPIVLPTSGFGSAAAFLLVSGAARAASRWFAGVLGDRGPGRLILVGSIGVTFVGLVALASHGSSLVVIFAAAAFGAGYGGVQTAVYLAMVANGSSDHRNNVSALWNSGIDLGASLGGTLIGLAASRYGYAAAIWAIPAVVLISLPLVLLPGRAQGQAETSGGAQKTTSTSSSSIS
jgi:predicted MFS family arabinose efflux permease